MKNNRLMVVVPCFNEEKRLNLRGFAELIENPLHHLVFVNDGSRDSTLTVLQTFQLSRPDQIHVLNMEQNSGKAEAVRHGLMHAMALGADVVGYYDADLATPAGEMLRIVEALESAQAQMALGARVLLLGRDIQRKAVRHYLGRVFATFASMTLQMPVYDTQCGAKALRVTPALKLALQEPFRASWIFDVELIARLRALGLGLEDFIEVPLLAWKDVAGSKLNPTAMARSLGDLAMIAVRQRLAPRAIALK